MLKRNPECQLDWYSPRDFWLLKLVAACAKLLKILKPAQLVHIYNTIEFIDYYGIIFIKTVILYFTLQIQWNRM